MKREVSVRPSDFCPADQEPEDGASAYDDAVRFLTMMSRAICELQRADPWRGLDDETLIQ